MGAKHHPPLKSLELSSNPTRLARFIAGGLKKEARREGKGGRRGAPGIHGETDEDIFVRGSSSRWAAWMEEARGRMR